MTIHITPSAVLAVCSVLTLLTGGLAWLGRLVVTNIQHRISAVHTAVTVNGNKSEVPTVPDRISATENRILETLGDRLDEHTRREAEWHALVLRRLDEGGIRFGRHDQRLKAVENTVAHLLEGKNSR